MTIDELSIYDVATMTDEEIEGFLSSHSVGVLGLPTDGAPSMRPMSYWFDGESTLYILYVLGSESRKAELSARADVARFLVYSAETMFTWRSVLLTGTVTEAPEEDRERVQSSLEAAWRPDVLQKAIDSEAVGIYQFRVDEQSGVKSMGLPPAFEREAGATDGGDAG
jgi:hypothetical protein